VIDQQDWHPEDDSENGNIESLRSDMTGY